MSTLNASPSSSANPPAGVPRGMPMWMETKIGEVIGTVGAITPSIVATWRFRINDLGDFHRKTVAKRLFGVGAKGLARQVLGQYRRRVYVNADPAVKQATSGLAAEFVIYTPKGDDKPGRFKNLEEGARISADDWMLMPYKGVAAAAGNKDARKATKAELEQLKNGDLARIPLPNGKILLAKVVRRGQRMPGVARVGPISPDQMMLGKLKPIAILSRDRTQRALLHFYDAWDKVSNDPRTVAKFDADLERAMTAAGAAALINRDQRTIDKIAAKAAEAAAERDPISGGAV